MNLYVVNATEPGWARLIDAENNYVGRVKDKVAEFLLRQGVAMDLRGVGR